MKSINPATGQLIRKYYTHTQDEVNEILQHVNESWEQWKLTSFVKRGC
jgi:acyl-CoA reductase-like NAD-dependent aldehyde dehydrogenase